MIVVARGVGHRVDRLFSGHYSLLRTIEENFGLPLLGNAGDSVQVTSLYPLLLTGHVSAARRRSIPPGPPPGACRSAALAPTA